MSEEKIGYELEDIYNLEDEIEEDNGEFEKCLNEGLNQDFINGLVKKYSGNELPEKKENIDELLENLKRANKEREKCEECEEYNCWCGFEIDNGEFDEILKQGVNWDLLEKIDKGLIK